VKRTIVNISDMHVGSRWGIFPPGFQGATGEVIQLNVGQEYLNECWEHQLKVLPKRFDILLLNGDIIHGKNKKENALHLTEQDPEWQVRAAKVLLEPLAKRARAVLATQGSPYHTGPGGWGDEALAHSLKARPDPAGHSAWDWALWNVDGVLLDVCHRESACIRYGSMPLEREQQFDRMSADIKGGSADLIIRAHIHTFQFLNADGELAVSSPAWCLQGGFAKLSISPNRKLSRLIGSVKITLFPDKKPAEPRNKGDYVSAEPIWYPTPRLGYERIEL